MMKNIIKVKMIDKIIIIVLVSTLMASCGNNESKGITITPDAPAKEDLVSLVLENNDTYAYNSFFLYYYDDLTILPIAVHMAEKQKYGPAYYDLFHIFYSVFKENSVSIDSITQKHMMYYLEKGIELKDTDCVWTMSSLYMTGTFVDRDTIKAKDNLLIVFSQNDIDRIYWKLLRRQAEAELGNRRL